MTALTILLENGEYVLRESNRGGLSGCHAGDNHRQPEEPDAYNLASLPGRSIQIAKSHRECHVAWAYGPAFKYRQKNS